jgi:chromosome segregation protein
MKLKRLDIHGFKSFYHRTTVVFDDGITGVVGPNGCGKSNIVDAIKWVMGEQGAKALRGSSMEDVIFNGSDKRKSMGLCEVRLTFENDGTARVPAPWHEVGEIAIERRLERTKGSDYLINQKRCRLADVQDIIAGTGVGGRRAYAIIEQGQISRIVSARADERRLLIEEAAGITRYRTRRRLAERKMIETQQNLERVDDIIGEIERQMRSLRRQAKKAERYREYRDEAKGIALRVAVFESIDLTVDLREQEALVKSLQQAEIDGVVAVQAAEANRTATQLKEREARQTVQTVADTLRVVEERALVAGERLASSARERDMLNAQLDRAKYDLESGEGRRSELEAERDETAAKLAATEIEAQREADELAQREEEKTVALRALLNARADAESLIRQEAEEVQALGRARSDLDHSVRRQRELAERKGRLIEQNAGLVEKLVDHAGKVAEARGRAERSEGTALAARTAQSDAVEALNTYRAELESAVEEERRLRDEIVQSRSRRDSLAEVERRREELGDGARALLDLGITGLLGTVSDLLEVPAELEAAVLAALGMHIDGVVVQDGDGLAAAIEHLSGGVGRTMLALANVEPPTRGAQLPQASGVEGFLGDAIGGGKSAHVVAHLINDAVLVSDLTAANDLAATGWPGVIVTRSGERLENGALYTVGSGSEDAGPLGRRREIKALDELLVSLSDEHVALEGRLDKSREGQSAARATLDAARSALQQAEIARSATNKDFEQLARDHERAEQTAQRFREELGQIDAQIEEAASTEKTAALALKSAEDNRGDRRRAMEASEERVRDTEATRDATVSAVHDAKARAMGRNERLLTTKTLLSRLDRQINEIQVRRDRVVSLGADVERRLEELEKETAVGKEIRQTAEAESETLAAELVTLRVTHQNLVEAVSRVDETLEETRRRRDTLRSKQGDARLEFESIKLKLQALEDRMRDRYHVTLGEIIPIYEGDERPGNDEAVRLGELEVLLERMGEVNVGAIEEFEAVEERYVFLVAQREDLLSALADLEQAISEIDQTSKELFRETFDCVNGHFQTLFPRLFRGGEAALILTDPDNLLETGIEMYVSPPGKKVQTVELLSGGEKAMCAIALVFAVFRHRPSPFCLLDEVDAPLDDANIGRFNEVVREIAQTSQVVLVTHNKRTMEIADALYGVTMEESGVSKLVGVRMS